MKKILSIILLLLSINLYSQVGYWTAYNFQVEEGSEELVLKYFNEYFSNNKLAEGVTVSLFENHFKDADWNFSHQILFVGPLDGLSTQYSTAPSDAWSLFILKMNRHITLHSSFMGDIDISYGNGATKDFPIQRVYSLEANDPAKYLQAFKKYNSKYNKADRLILTGGFSAGIDRTYGNTWIVQSFKDFKGAFGGHAKLPSKYSPEEHRKAWMESRKNNGGVELRRSFLRILLATY